MSENMVTTVQITSGGNLVVGAKGSGDPIKAIRNTFFRHGTDHGSVYEDSGSSSIFKRFCILSCKVCGSSAKEHGRHTDYARNSASKCLTSFCKAKHCPRFCDYFRYRCMNCNSFVDTCTHFGPERLRKSCVSRNCPRIVV